MNEEGWLACTDSHKMLEFLRHRVSSLTDYERSRRKDRLFACAFCHRNWHFLADPVSRMAVETTERFVDGRATIQDLQHAFDAAWAVNERTDPYNSRDRTLKTQVVWVAAMTAQHVSIGVCSAPAEATRIGALRPEDAYAQGERAALPALLRHIIGNPFRPYPTPPSWPSQVVQLASAMYEGQPCSFALHDALLEAGHSELAEHFKEEQWHPKGCWVLDMILGKK